MSETPPVPDAIRVRNIDHYTIIVSDLERSKAFYCGILGMQEVPRPNFSFPGKWFQAGPTQIHLILAHEGSAPAGFPPSGTTASPGRVTHLAFEIGDARAAAEYLPTRGVPLRGEPRHRPDGPLQVFITDPDGYVVEVFSR
ncbi:MAG: VOC family protein [Planctomycetales bacterium]